jgi:hypothetical protein
MNVYLGGIMQRHKFSANKFYNLSEPGNCIHILLKTICAKGMKQVGNVTTAALNAISNHIPPMLIFPRINFKDHTMDD